MSPRGIAWLGGLLIAITVGTAIWDIVRAYYKIVENTGHELDTQARVIAEQTTRSLQAVDVVLRHLEQQHSQGALQRLSQQELRDYLREQAVGLVQIDGLLVVRADGTVKGSSYINPDQESLVHLSGQPFRTAQHSRKAGMIIGNAIPSTVDGRWIFPMMRRLETPTGEFAGTVAARGRIDYFQKFYQNVRPDEGTHIILIHLDGTLLARYPEAASALGKRFPQFEEMRAYRAAGRPWPRRSISPVDGIERFSAFRPVPDYPLAVMVARDTAVALAQWREVATAAAIRLLTMSVLAATLLALVMRQFSRLDAAQRSLAISQERFAVAVAGSDDGIWDWDYATGQAFASPRAREILGLPPGPDVQPEKEWLAAVTGQIHPDDATRRSAAIKAHLSGKTSAYEGEYRMRRPEGGYRWVRIRGTCVRRDGEKPHRMAGSISDIDAAKRAEDALRESEERFALAVAGSNDGIVDWDVVNDRMYSSERAMQIVGIDSKVTVRSRAEWRELVKYHPDDVARMKQDLDDFLSGRTNLREGDYRVLLPDGGYRWIRHRNKCVRDEAGRPIRVAGSVSDIDAQKRVEGQLLQAKKLEAIGTLAGGIAHDFNNILAAILGYGEMAQKDAREGSSLRRHIDAAVAAGLRAKSLVERILAFSRSGVGERVPVHVQSVVAEALDAVAASLPDHVRLERHLAAGDGAVMGDPTQIHQVVMNLCTNGAHAIRSSGTLTVSLDVIEKSGTMAATSALSAGRYIRLRVRDTGGGIAPGVIERVFDPFFTTKKVGVGTGLGLSLVHGIVTDLGGGIDVESQVGQGTMFVVYLPLTDSAAAGAPVDESAPTGSGETVLLVDDEEMLVRLGEEMIAALGYEPVGFTSSTAALEAFRKEPGRFNAVLTDETMPDMTGSELAREIRAIRSDVSIVLMSGFVTPALAARARAAGVMEVLAKPLVSRDLARHLSAAVRQGARR